MKPFSCYIAGEPVDSESRIPVTNPYTGKPVGSVPSLNAEDLQSAVKSTAFCPDSHTQLTRFQRSEILRSARTALIENKKEFSDLITSEAGLCVRESQYEVGRACDVLEFAAIEALKDDGQTFSCDLTANGKQRKIFTLREPLRCVGSITPFNHPLNQVAHKVAPAIACGTPTILKPSLKTPLTAIKFTELLYKSGLPGWMLSVITGEDSIISEGLVSHPDIELLSFTGSETIGKHIASRAGYKKLVLELGGNDPLIVLEDADLNLAARLACEGSFRNSGQRCTAVKRLLIQKSILPGFIERFTELAATYSCGDPTDPETRVGTVIDENAAIVLEKRVRDAIEMGARLLLGGKREGALMHPTILTEVPRNAEMITRESFGPLAPIIPVDDLDDAIAVSNSASHGLSSGIVTNNLTHAIHAIKNLKVGTCNVNEIPGFRIESSPFGGIKDSGLGIKEGVIEAMKMMSTVKTFSLPW